MFISSNWKTYELIDTDSGKRLERWGDYILIRPDPQVIWKGTAQTKLWKKADASYLRSHKGGGSWDGKSNLPEQWQIEYASLNLIFRIRPMGFKHTGLFPEQAVNWEWFSTLIATAKAENPDRPLKVLNLFAYTGGATLAAARAGASVVHVDAAKNMVAQAKENASLSGLGSAPIRYIVDDCRKFVERELRRGNRYDGIIMDPPSYGRGPTGEVWKLEDNIHDFVNLCAPLLSDDPLFFLVNSYTTGLSPSTMGYILHLALDGRFGGKVTCDEVGLPVTASGLPLPCGAAARWEKNG